MKLHLPAALVIAALGVAGCGVAHPIAAAHPGAGSAVSTTGPSGPAATAPRIAPPLPSHAASLPSAAVPSPRSAASLVSADAPPTTTSVVRPHFGTPQAAMRYLADAYNRDDVAALHYVTTPSSFNPLIAMRSEAVDLQLKSCAPTGHGDYNWSSGTGTPSACTTPATASRTSSPRPRPTLAGTCTSSRTAGDLIRE